MSDFMLTDASVRIESIQKGAIIDLANEELASVIGNIHDLNTEASAVRELNIKIKFKPLNETRKVINTEIFVTHKPAPRKPIKSEMIAGQRGKDVELWEDNPAQVDAFDQIEKEKEMKGYE